MKNAYVNFTKRALEAFEKMYKHDIHDHDLTERKRKNAKIKLELVRQALKLK